jgi:hypothetical protein
MSDNSSSTAQDLCITQEAGALWLKKLPGERLKISTWNRQTKKESVIFLNSEEYGFVKNFINNGYKE